MNLNALNAFAEAMSKEATGMPDPNGIKEEARKAVTPTTPPDPDVAAPINFGKHDTLTMYENKGRSTKRVPNPKGDTVADLTTAEGKAGLGNLKEDRKYAAGVNESPDMIAAKNKGSWINDAKVWIGSQFRGSKDQQLSERGQAISDVYSKNIEEGGIFGAKERARKFQNAYDAERSSAGTLNQANPSADLSKGGYSPQIAKGMEDVQARTKAEYDKRMGEAISKWGPWVAGLGLAGIGLYGALSHQGQNAQQANATQAPEQNWAQDVNWKGPGVADEETA